MGKGFAAMDRNKRAKLKICVDIASVIFVLTLIACAWWEYVAWERPHFRERALPVVDAIFFADGLPFLFGLSWIGFRYKNAFDQKVPVIFDWRVLITIILAAVGAPIALMILSGR
jgi:hypothetical protein